MNLPVSRRSWAALAAVLALTLVFRLPSLFEPPWYDDEGIYAAVAHALLRGERLYVDVMDNRPPGIYWLYAAMLAVSGYSIFFVKLTATLFFLGTQTVMFALAGRLWGPWTGIFAIAVFGFLGSIPLLEGNLANTELFMMLPIAVGMLLAVNGRWFGAGVALGCAILIKQIAGLEAVAIGLAVLLCHPRPLGVLRRYAAGFLSPVAIAAGYLLLQGSLGEFAFVGIGYYFGYVQRESRLPFEFQVVKLAVLALGTITMWWLFNGPRSLDRFRQTLVPLWCAAALYGAFFTGRPYPHYLLQALPPLLLVTGWVFINNWNRSLQGLTGGKVAAGAGVAIAACAVFLFIYLPFPSWARPEKSVGYYQNFIGRLTGQVSESKYNEFFDRRVNRNLRLIQFLKTNTRPGNSVLIWGEEPWLYALARVDVAPPFTVSYFAYEMPSGLQRVVESVNREHPEYVIWTRNKPMYPQLRAVLDDRYVEAFAFDNAAVYRRADLPPVFGQALRSTNP